MGHVDETVTVAAVSSGRPNPTPTTAADLPTAVLSELSRSADWISSWWTAVALAAVSVALVWWLVRRRRAWRTVRQGTLSDAPGRRWRRGVVTSVGTMAVVLMVIATAAIAANAFSGYVPGVAALKPTLQGWGLIAPSNARWNPQENAGDAAHGAVRTVKIPGTSAERMSGGPAWVYTPPGFDPAAGIRYPVVYLIHGSPGRPSDFFAAADAGKVMDLLIGAEVAPPMILVSIDVNGTGPSSRDTECLDSTTGGSQVESYVTRTVVAWTDANLPTIADRDHRVIGGASSGGFCALNLGLRHTDQYGAILALMPYGDPGSGGAAMLSSREEFAANTPMTYLPTMEFAAPVEVFLDTGTAAGSEARGENRRLAEMLIDREQRVELREEMGQGHTWAMVSAGLPYALRFAGVAVGGPIGPSAP